MPQKQKGPGAGNAEARQIAFADFQRGLSNLTAEHLPVQFWLHVSTDSSERHYWYEPDVRALRITVAGGVEKTRTRSIETLCGPWRAIIAVKPRGADWVLADDSDDKWSEWQRPAVPS